MWHSCDGLFFIFFHFSYWIDNYVLNINILTIFGFYIIYIMQPSLKPFCLKHIWTKHTQMCLETKINQYQFLLLFKSSILRSFSILRGNDANLIMNKDVWKINYLQLFWTCKRILETSSICIKFWTLKLYK